MPTFTCKTCSAPFEVPEKAIAKYPGWTPRYCRECSPKKKGAKSASSSGSSRKKWSGKKSRGGSAREENLTRAQVLERYSGGPADGVFTDGSASPNPGPGGWGAVWVEKGRIREERYGKEPATTNNRMELKALIEAYKLLPEESSAVVYTDSKLCVSTITQWAAGWKKLGWKRKSGPIKNLELVQELYALSLERPGVELKWIAAHSGNLWNEYADSLATAWMRETV
ncbi:MAG: ribonuclease H [Planctomycetota bacterium]